MSKNKKKLELQSPLRYRVLFVPVKCLGEVLSPHLALQLTFSKNGNDKTRKIKYRFLSLKRTTDSKNEQKWIREPLYYEKANRPIKLQLSRCDGLESISILTPDQMCSYDLDRGQCQILKSKHLLIFRILLIFDFWNEARTWYVDGRFESMDPWPWIRVKRLKCQNF